MKIFGWIRRLYDKILELAQSPKAVYWLVAISFAESSFFPIPPDVILLPMCLASRDKALRYALICTAASVAGGLFGYALGAFFFDTLGQGILNFYGIQSEYAQFKGWYDEFGAVMVFAAGFSPIPYKVITISAGMFQFALVPFLALSAASRGLRFGIEALIIRQFGDPAMAFIDKHFNKLTIIGVILLVGGFLAVKLLGPGH